MQPENSQRVPNGPEQAPIAPIAPENMAHLPPLEVGPIGGQERFEQTAEAGARAADAAASATTQAAPLQQAAPVQIQPQQQAPPSGTPLVAADEDLIEKEWVDKAKEIIQETKDDPHARTVRVNELKMDYLQKRYGKVLGASE